MEILSREAFLSLLSFLSFRERERVFLFVNSSQLVVFRFGFQVLTCSDFTSGLMSVINSSLMSVFSHFLCFLLGLSFTPYELSCCLGWIFDSIIWFCKDMYLYFYIFLRFLGEFSKFWWEKLQAVVITVAVKLPSEGLKHQRRMNGRVIICEP